MIRKITVIIAAAACAGIMVTFMPGFAPDVAAGASQSVDPSVPTVAHINKPIEVATPRAADIRNAVEQDIRNASRDSNVCAQGWPYYDHSCLSDIREANGKARAVRIIAIDRYAAIRSQR